MNDLSKISVVLPSLDPDEKLIAVVDGLLEYGFSHIILVNDGSKQENLHYQVCFYQKSNTSYILMKKLFFQAEKESFLYYQLN